MSVQDPGIIFSLCSYFKYLFGIVGCVEDQIVQSDIYTIEFVGNSKAVDHGAVELLIGRHHLRIYYLCRDQSVEEFAVNGSSAIQNIAVDIVTQRAKCLFIVDDRIIIHRSVRNHDQIGPVDLDVYILIYSVIVFFSCGTVVRDCTTGGCLKSVYRGIDFSGRDLRRSFESILVHNSLSGRSGFLDNSFFGFLSFLNRGFCGCCFFRRRCLGRRRIALACTSKSRKGKTCTDKQCDSFFSHG